MKILALNSKSIDHVVSQLQRFGTAFSLDTEPDWSVRYDCIIGQIDADTWEMCKNSAATVLLEFPDSRLAQKLRNEYTTFSSGNLLSVVLSFGKVQEDSDLESRFACKYRSALPIRSVGCVPCQSLTGKSLVPVFKCSLFDCECTVASREIAGEGKAGDGGRRSKRAAPCTTCKEREP